MTEDVTGDMPVKLRRLSKLLETTVERLEEVESLQAVTVGEQDEISERLAALAERLRIAMERRCACMTRETLAEDPFRNSTEHEEYRPS
ncbi:hypothetical protein G3I59_31200 [Amycolatopsis rubida]|uniref:Uncharacterized protein n=1 Tax=Amycolatopsis rubida TaxID=112413 RepID=A0ABX0BXZ6_9PSEU|nr:MULTISPECIES: hypothetical protein [Amycolatopsis]MYW94947.1 hypothetical protein [Amycolatopsis rubida]NEC59934.1 hypothetical protein [Amycolatopsis rubida]OAP25671.1 hypothetical protein A4R44_03045 [Amycolatopsis sp. M39]